MQREEILVADGGYEYGGKDVNVVEEVDREHLQASGCHSIARL